MLHCVIGEDVFLATNYEPGERVESSGRGERGTNSILFCSVRGSASVRGQDRES